jgi:flagellar hook assembly protein FlgD
MSNTVTVPPISPTSPAGVAAANQAKNGGGQNLTQADFLKIMVAQFTQQDPLSSSDGSGGSGTSDYVTQLMSMTNLTTLQTMSGQQAQQLAESLPGQTVEINDNTTDASGSLIITSGVVQSARVDGPTGAVYFTAGGKEYPSADLYSISQAAAAQTSAEAPTQTGTPTPQVTP